MHMRYGVNKYARTCDLKCVACVACTQLLLVTLFYFYYGTFFRCGFFRVALAGKYFTFVTHKHTQKQFNLSMSARKKEICLFVICC